MVDRGLSQPRDEEVSGVGVGPVGDEVVGVPGGAGPLSPHFYPPLEDVRLAGRLPLQPVLGVQLAGLVAGDPDVLRQPRHQDGLGGLAVLVTGHAVVAAHSGVGDAQEDERVMVVLVGHHQSGVLLRQEGVPLARQVTSC